MRKILFGSVLTLLIVFSLRYCEHKKDQREKLTVNSAMIEKQLKNVSKLVVTEGNFAQIYTYEDLKTLYFDWLTAEKKAIVVVNAEASIAYDLSKIETRIDEESKTVTIVNIPEPELTINPNIEYYDLQQNYLNQFEAEDYNKIKSQVEDSLRKKIEKSALVTNAQNRLISELQKIYVLTSSLGWTLRYRETTFNSEIDNLHFKN